MTASALSYFALSIPFHSIFYFITRAFYAAHDSKTPLFINLFSILLNICLSVLFVIYMKLPVWSLGISFSVAITLNVIIHFIAFYKKVGGYDVTRLLHHTAKIYIASFLSALPSYAVIKVFDQLIIDTSRSLNVFSLLLLACVVFSLSLIHIFLLTCFKTFGNFRSLYHNFQQIEKSVHKHRDQTKIVVGHR